MGLVKKKELERGGVIGGGELMVIEDGWLLEKVKLNMYICMCNFKTIFGQ